MVAGVDEAALRQLGKEGARGRRKLAFGQSHRYWKLLRVQGLPEEGLLEEGHLLALSFREFQRLAARNRMAVEPGAEVRVPLD